MEVSGQFQMLASLPQGKEPLVPTGYEGLEVNPLQVGFFHMYTHIPPYLIPVGAGSTSETHLES
jgi:hypothetical protein